MLASKFFVDFANRTKSSTVRSNLMCLCIVAQSCLTLCDPMDCSLPGSSVHGDSPGKNSGVGCHALLQGIVPTQGSNPCLLYGTQILYRLSHHESPILDSFIVVRVNQCNSLWYTGTLFQSLILMCGWSVSCLWYFDSVSVEQ